MITKLTIKTKNGKESTWTKEEAKELYNALHELFGVKEVVVERYKDYWKPSYPYHPWITYTSGGDFNKKYAGASVTMLAKTDEKAPY